MEKKRTALVIGGSRGVGREIALEAARRDVHTTVIARNFRKDDRELLEAARPIWADVSREDDMDHLKRETIWTPDHVFWVAGAFLQGRVADATDAQIEHVLNMHQTAMVQFLRRIVRTKVLFSGHELPLPVTIGVVGSVSAFLRRNNEAVYAMAKAGQAAFLRQYAPELARELPGSRIVLANSGRIASESGTTKTDGGGVQIDPNLIARRLWSHIQSPDQLPCYHEMNFLRSSEGVVVQDGLLTPEFV